MTADDRPALASAGTIEPISVLADQLDIDSRPLAAITNINLDYVGYGIVAVFFISWLTALAGRRLARIEERWSTTLAANHRHSARQHTEPSKTHN